MARRRRSRERKLLSKAPPFRTRHPVVAGLLCLALDVLLAWAYVQSGGDGVSQAELVLVWSLAVLPPIILSLVFLSTNKTPWAHPVKQREGGLVVQIGDDSYDVSYEAIEKVTEHTIVPLKNFPSLYTVRVQVELEPGGALDSFRFKAQTYSPGGLLEAIYQLGARGTKERNRSSVAEVLRIRAAGARRRAAEHALDWGTE